MHLNQTKFWILSPGPHSVLSWEPAKEPLPLTKFSWPLTGTKVMVGKGLVSCAQD